MERTVTEATLQEIVCHLLGGHDEVANIDTFSETGDCSLEGKRGCVVTLHDGSEFRVTIVRTESEWVKP